MYSQGPNVILQNQFPLYFNEFPCLQKLPFCVISIPNSNFIVIVVKLYTIYTKVSKGAKVRNRYNQVPHLTQDTNGKMTNSQLDTTNESPEVSPFPTGDHKAHILGQKRNAAYNNKKCCVLNESGKFHHLSMFCYFFFRTFSPLIY